MSESEPPTATTDLVAPIVDPQRSTFDHIEVTNLFIQNDMLRNKWSMLKEKIDRSDYENNSEHTQLLFKLRMIKDLITTNVQTIERLRNAYGFMPTEDEQLNVPRWVPINEAHVEKIPNKNQYRHYKYVFNFHHRRKKNGIDVFRCNRYNDLKCPAQLLLDPISSRCKFFNSHNCSMRQFSTSSQKELSEHR